MIKSELVSRIAAQNPHLYVRDADRLVNAILDQIVAAMARRERVELRGFGTFGVKVWPARDRPRPLGPALFGHGPRPRLHQPR